MAFAWLVLGCFEQEILGNESERELKKHVSRIESDQLTKDSFNGETNKDTWQRNKLAHTKTINLESSITLGFKSSNDCLGRKSSENFSGQAQTNDPMSFFAKGKEMDFNF